MRRTNWISWIIAITIAFTLSHPADASESHKIGVLAKNGPVRCLAMWKSMADYLTAKLKGKNFEIVPLDFEEVNPAVESGDVEFFLVNSSMFVTTKVKYSAAPIATMINTRQGQALESFGGVILTSAWNENINNLGDIKGRSFMAVKESSFGGWQMAYKEFLDAGIDPFQDFASLEFAGKHENVVLAVQNGVADAGTVRTDTLERMAASGLIEMEEFRIVHKMDHPGFPFVSSTPLYPEWPLARVASTSQALSEEVVGALLEMKPGDKAAKDAKIVGWTQPLDYAPVERLQMSLKIGGFAE